MGDSTTIEVLYFEGCPHYAATLDLVRQALEDLGMPADVVEREVRDPQEATRLRFLGSPTVRVNGIDVEPGANRRTEFALGCRLYDGSGVPPRDLVTAALADARALGGI